MGTISFPDTQQRRDKKTNRAKCAARTEIGQSLPKAAEGQSCSRNIKLCPFA